MYFKSVSELGMWLFKECLSCMQGLCVQCLHQGKNNNNYNSNSGNDNK